MVEDIIPIPTSDNTKIHEILDGEKAPTQSERAGFSFSFVLPQEMKDEEALSVKEVNNVKNISDDLEAN